MNGEKALDDVLHTPLPYTQVISEITRAISVAASHEEFLHGAVHKIAQGLSIPHVAIYTFDPYNTSVVLKAVHTPTPQAFPLNQVIVPANSNTIFGWAVTNQRPYYLPQLEQELIQNREPHIWEDAQSLLLVPLIAGSKVVGVLDVQSGQKNAFPPALYNVLCTLADQIALSFLVHPVTSSTPAPQPSEPLQSQTSLSVTTLSDAFLRACLAKLPDISEIFTELTALIHQTYGLDVSFGVARYDSTQHQITFPLLIEHGQPIHVEPLRLGQGLTSYVITQKAPLLIQHGVEETARTLGVNLIGIPAKSWLGVPLRLGEEILGALILQDVHREARFDENDLQALEVLATLIAWLLHTHRLRERAETAQRQVVREHTLLTTLLESLPERIAIKDENGRILYANKALLQHYGVNSLTDLMGKTEVDLLGEAGNLDLIQDLEVIHSGVARIKTPNYYFSLQGENTWELVSRIPITSEENGGPRLIRIAQDISEFIRTEQVAQRRAEQLLASAEIAREAISARDIDTMLQNATNQIRERLGYYHASVFLLDPLGRYAVLREASGDVGQIMKQTGHQLAVGSRSLVGQAMASGRTIVANNVQGNPDYYPNPLLPETRSEIVVPLRVGDRLLGALDVQSRSLDAFQPEDVQILETLAGLLAIALDNILLYTRTQQNLAQHRHFYRIISEASVSLTTEEMIEKTLQGLHELLPHDRLAIFLLNRDQVLELKAYTGFEAERLEQTAWQTEESLPGWVIAHRQALRIGEFSPEIKFHPLVAEAHSALALPLSYQNEILGVLYIESEQPAAFDESDQELFASLTTNLAAILTNARLIHQIQIQAERQRRLYEITSKIRALTDVGNILQTSAAEIGRALGAQRVNIRISPPTSSSESLSDLNFLNGSPTDSNGRDR
ncbi:MAG: GAF domain-containing protein [Thermanaerothrix sp.]|nr:GAF domain-containing protein [Thermanaerothrix sp.]